MNQIIQSIYDFVSRREPKHVTKKSGGKQFILVISSLTSYFFIIDKHFILLLESIGQSEDEMKEQFIS